MSGQTFEDSWWLLVHARGVGALLRLFVVLGAFGALLSVHAASGRPVGPIDVAVMLLAALCVVLPDSNVGLLVVVLVGVEWLAFVDDTTSPWSLGAALSLLVFHASLAAASIAAPAARWSLAMRRRWARRCGALALATAVTWLVVAVTGRYDVAASSALVASALLILALGGMWAAGGRGPVSRRGA